MTKKNTTSTPTTHSTCQTSNSNNSSSSSSSRRDSSRAAGMFYFFIITLIFLGLLYVLKRRWHSSSSSNGGSISISNGNDKGNSNGCWIMPRVGLLFTLITGNPSFSFYLLLCFFSLGYLYRHSLRWNDTKTSPYPSDPTYYQTNHYQRRRRETLSESSSYNYHSYRCTYTSIID